MVGGAAAVGAGPGEAAVLVPVLGSVPVSVLVFSGVREGRWNAAARSRHTPAAAMKDPEIASYQGRES